jgi:hypothetical protein
MWGIKMMDRSRVVFDFVISLYFGSSGDSQCIPTKTKHVSTKQKVPDLPIPAEQWTMGGPTFSSRAPDFLTSAKNPKNAEGLRGTPKSGHVV